MLITNEEEGYRNVIMEIRAGTGGEEAALFAADLFRMYTKYADKRGWECIIIDSGSTGLGGLKEVVFSIEGENVYKYLRLESGTHRVQRVPRTEASGRIHTSACTVAVLPEAEEVEVEIKPEDLKIDTYSAGGPGGQHVNKTASAVRITHIPTGIIVQCQNERSQHQNKQTAMKLLVAKLNVMKEKENENDFNKIYGEKGEIAWSYQIRSYTLHPYSLVKDHRTGLEVGNAQAVLDGDKLTVFMEEYLKNYKLHRNSHLNPPGNKTP
jgi:peptide chain release factor 1